MDNLVVLETNDPVDHGAIERALSHPVFDELCADILASSVEEPGERASTRPSRSPRSTARRWRVPVAAAAAVVALVGVLAGVGAIEGGGRGLSHPFTTAWAAGRPFVHAGSGGATTRHGTWRLVGELRSGTWQQNVYGPPPGVLSCSTPGACYVVAGTYRSSHATTPVAETLYVSTNDGATWSALPLPHGLVPTTPLECSGPQWCATGGTYESQPVLAVTRDGGHSFTIDPLPAGVGTLHTVSCPSSGMCMGLVSAALRTQAPVDATLLVTSDGGSTFHDEPILPGDSMVGLSCTSATACTAVGLTDASAHELVPVGVSALTTDQGRTWRAGSLPVGFGVTFSQLTCADAQHCFVTGFVPIPNDPGLATAQCASTRTASTRTAPFPAMSPEVAAISKTETELKAAAAAAASGKYHVSQGACQAVTLVSDVATSRDGGLTWTPDVLPADVPAPELNGLSCPTATVCWAGGQEAVAQKIGNGVNLGSSVLIGTTDGGSTWSKVVFSVPATAPNPTGQSYLSIGSVTCPSASVCLAGGMAAAGSRDAPVYSLVVPGD